MRCRSYWSCRIASAAVEVIVVVVASPVGLRANALADVGGVL
jgi:hypothetical protein